MDGTNIFGDDTSGNLDVSDEALADRWEEVESFDADPPAEGEEADAEAAEEEPEAEGDEQADDGAEVEEADDSLPEDLAGKSPSELAKIIADQRSMIARQSNEVGEVRKAIEQQQLALQQLQQQQAAAYYDDDEDLSDIITDTVQAERMYQQGLQALAQGQVAPAVIEEIIDATHAVDPRLAGRMGRDFAMRIARAEMLAQMEPQIQTSREYAVRQASNALYADETLGPDAKAYESEIIEVLKGQPLGNTPAEVLQTMKSALIHVRGLDPSKSLAARSARLEAEKLNGRVEEGSAEAPAPVTEADRFKQSVFEHRARSGGNDLFAGFGGGQ